MTAPALEVRGLRKTFHGRGAKDQGVVAVDDVSFTVPARGSLAIVGESGSGKSTIARMLVGLERPDAGAILVGGAEAGVRPRGRTARLRRARSVQLVFQNPYGSLDPRLTIEDSLELALRLHGHGSAQQRKTRTGELLDRVGLGHRERTALPGRLSGGQLQRAAIARSLCVEPDVLVLDEAVAALDVSIQAQILELLGELRADHEVAYVFVSHDLAVVEAISEEIVVLQRGTVVEHGPTADVLRTPTDDYTRMLLDSVPRPGWSPA